MAFEHALERLAPHATLLAPVFSCFASGGLRGAVALRALASATGHSTSRLAELETALSLCEDVGCASNAHGLWSIALSPDDAGRLGLMLQGVSVYLRRVHRDVDTVRVVVSHPAKPSKLVHELEQTLMGTWGLSETADALLELAQSAKSRLSIMTPFVDDEGASRIIELLGLTGNGVVRELIVRGGLPEALRARQADLIRLRAAVYDFRIARDESGTTETFHAKVVRADQDECYVGSSNMTTWSFNYSLEMGFRVRGAAARRVSQVLDAVINVSKRLDY